MCSIYRESTRRVNIYAERSTERFSIIFRAVRRSIFGEPSREFLDPEHGGTIVDGKSKVREQRWKSKFRTIHGKTYEDDVVETKVDFKISKEKRLIEIAFVISVVC